VVNDERNAVYKKFALYEKANATGFNTRTDFKRILNPHEYFIMSVYNSARSLCYNMGPQMWDVITWNPKVTLDTINILLKILPAYL
jgi:hypothetical protein